MQVSRRSILALAAAASVGLAVWCVRWGPGPDLGRTYRIGFQEAPPRQFVDPQGRPYGSAIDLLNEAARRGGVKLEWVQVPEGPDRALSEGLVDLWPVVNRIPERSHLHITQPMFEVNYWLVSLDSGGGLSADDVAGKRLGITKGLAAYVVRKHLPRAKPETFGSIPELIQNICRGGVAAAVIADSIAHSSLFKKPESCQLRMSPIPGARLWSGIGARPGSRAAIQVADLLRREIGARGPGRDLLDDFAEVVRLSHQRSPDR